MTWGKPMGWSLQGGLHTEYSSDFMQRNRGKIHCVFHDNLLSNLIKDLDALRLSEPASPPRPRGRLDSEQLLEQFKEMTVEGRKTLFSALVDCAKGFLTAEDRDEMANLIRPDPTPLPPVTLTATPVVTTIGGTPLNTVPQLPATTAPVSLPVTTIAVVVTAAITPVMTTPKVVITTTVTPVTSAVPVSITPQGGTVSSAQRTVTPIGEATEAVTTVTASEVSVISQASSTVAFSVLPSVSGTFPSNSQSQQVVGTFTTPSGSTHQRPPPGIIMGVEGLTLPSDPAVTVTATMARLVDPLGSHTRLGQSPSSCCHLLGRCEYHCHRDWDNPWPGYPWTLCCSWRLYRACS